MVRLTSPTSLLQDLEAVWRQSSQLDLSWRTEDGTLTSHALVMAAASALLRNALQEVENEDEDRVVIVPGMRAKEMETILKLIYGQLEWEDEDSEETRLWLAAFGIHIKKGDDSLELLPKPSGSPFQSPPSDFDVPEADDLGEGSSNVLGIVQEPLFACGQCDKQFKTADLLYRHEESHSPWLGKIFVCDICQKTFRSGQALAIHSRTHSAAPAEFKCIPCNLNFKSKRYLHQHARRKHQGSSGHPCDTCHKVLSSKAELAAHNRTHTGEKPYPCSLCDARFRFRSTRNTHLKMHRNDRRHECGACERRFIHAADLRKHARTHTNERPYQCKLCDKAFGRSDYLRKHLRCVHGETEAPSSVAVPLDPVGIAVVEEEEEDISANVNALLGEAILSEAVVELDSLEPTETMTMDLGEDQELTQRGDTSADWLKLNQPEANTS